MADQYLAPIRLNQVAAGLWASGAEILVIAIKAIAGGDADWLDFVEAVLDFLTKMAEAVDDEKFENALKTAKEVLERYKEGTETKEKLEDALETLQETLQKQ